MHRNKKSEARNLRRQRDSAEHALSEATETVSVYNVREHVHPGADVSLSLDLPRLPAPSPHNPLVPPKRSCFLIFLNPIFPCKNYVDLHGEALKGLDPKRQKHLPNGREIVNEMKSAEEKATRLAGHPNLTRQGSTPKL